MKKRILSFLLALLMLFGMLPVNVIAEGTENYDGDIGKYAKLNEAVSTFTVADGAGNAYTYYPEDFTSDTVLQVAQWKVDGTGLWYQVTFYSGSTQGDYVADFPTNPWFLQTGDALLFVEYCDICQEPDCGVDHNQTTDPTDPENPCECCENCTGAEDCQCGCENCQFCKPEVPENPCKCCENCTGAEDCECGCENCQFCKPEVPENPCKCCENCTGAEDCECGCENCQFCEPEEPTIPEVSDGNVIASGNLGEDAKLTVSAGSADKAEAFTSILSDLEDVNSFNQYVYDIDLSGSFEGSVELSVSGIPSAGSNERLLVIHLLDSAAAIEKARAAGTLQTYTGENLHLIYPEETAASGDNNTIYYEEISARRVAGNVTFSTSSFSEFIIYTVDFHYNGFEFSIPGGSGIYLSELFDRIGIERSVADVSSVTFTNYDLLSVVEDGDDWLLTSLRPFTSEEVLTILFSDGMEIAIAVTDASYDSSLYIFAFCANNTANPPIDKGYTNIENDKTNLLGRYKWIIHNNIIGGDGVITLENINSKTVTAYAQKPGRVEIRGTRNNDDGNYTTFQVFVFRSEDHFEFCGSREAQAVSVRVVDKNGKIVTGVPVTISRSGSSYTAKTDEFGYAWFFNLPGETTYTVNVAEFKASDGHWYTASSSVTTPKAKDQWFETTGSFHISQSTPSYSYVPEYSIVYHANDGSGETMTDSEHVKSGGQVTVDANSFSRDGYTFGGWYGNSDGTGTNYAVGSKATLTAGLNVYVKWNPISYVVSFDVVGATSGAIANKTYTFDTRYILPTPEKKYTVTYNHNDAADHGGTAVTSTADAAVTFDGWMDQGAITFKGKSYSYQGLEAERTKFDAPFYANPNKSSDVYEHVGNHYNKYGLVKHFFEYGINEYYNQNSEIRKPAPTSDLEKPGVYPGGAEVSNLSTTANAIVSLVARWSAAETLTLPTLTRTDYNFAGWYSDAALTNYVGDAGDPYTPTGDAELYAKWDPKTYGVTYKYTGTVPTGAPDVPVDANSYTSGSSVTVKSAPTSAPTGYTFSGWTTNDATVTNGKFTMPATDVTFTGSWTPKTDATYTVHYYKEGTTEKVQNDKVVSGATFDKVYSETAPETIGNYIIVGDKTKTVTAGYTGNVITFYYKEDVKYTVTYKYTGTVPTGAPAVPVDTNSYTSGSSVTVKPAPTPAPTGYTFSGWTTNDANVTDGKFTMPATDVTFTGSWTPKTDATYTVHYYKEGTTENVQDDKVVNGATFDKVYSETAPETIGNYIIVGDKTKTVTAGYTGNEVTFYYKLNAFSVSYAYTGEVPEGAAAAPAATTETVGSDVTVANAPTLTGYTFSGWSADGITITNGKFTMPATDVTFTGSWTLVNYTIMYELDGGKNNPLNPESYNVESEAITLGNPSKTGYNFTGWTGTDLADVTETVTIPKGSSGNRIYTANWTPKTYTITYNHNDKDTNPTTSTVSYDIEDEFTLNDAPTREGYKFSKWNLADGLTAPNGNWAAGDYDASQQIAKGKYGNITLVAQWTDQYRYVLKFNANTTDQVGNMPQNADTNWIDAATHTFTWSEVPTRENYDFLGWATSADATEAQFQNSYEVTTGKPHDTEEVTLYAVWKRQTGDLKLTFNGGETAPAIVTVSGQGKTITLVLTKAETVIKGLPTGEYSVAVESGNASYVASVRTNPNPKIESNQTAEVEITTGSKGLNWFTAFYWVKNKFGMQN